MAYPATLKDTRVLKQTGPTANYAASQANISQHVLCKHLVTWPTQKGCPFHEGSTVQLQSEGERDAREFRRLLRGVLENVKDKWAKFWTSLTQ